MHLFPKVMVKNSDHWSGVYRDLPVAVVGAAGFIGRWVARLLSFCGAAVHLTVRDAGPAAPIFREYGVSGEISEVDLLDRREIDSFLKKARPAITFNLAGYGVERAEHDAHLACRLNTELPAILAAAIARQCPIHRGPRLVHVGSGIEYGRSACELQETTIPTAPDTLYARTKLAGSMALQRFCVEHGFSALTVRLFTVYGPGEHAGRLLPSLLEAARRGNDFLLSVGYQQRDFAYVGRRRRRAAAPRRRSGHAVTHHHQPGHRPHGHRASVRGKRGRHPGYSTGELEIRSAAGTLRRDELHERIDPASTRHYRLGAQNQSGRGNCGHSPVFGHALRASTAQCSQNSFHVA